MNLESNDFKVCLHFCLTFYFFSPSSYYPIFIIYHDYYCYYQHYVMLVLFSLIFHISRCSSFSAMFQITLNKCFDFYNYPSLQSWGRVRWCDWGWLESMISFDRQVYRYSKSYFSYSEYTTMTWLADVFFIRYKV